MTYARPHIQTHSRGQGHSSVRGAAYRLGVDLVDERTAELCRFAKKGRDNVAARWHLADDDAPEWQRDAGTFWNAVEAGEKRKDSQVARDFRIPVPLGFDQEHAEKLALAVAGRVRAELGGCPVSVGLHHDNARDAFGDTKDPAQVGFHAHIYMPARGVAADGMATKKAGVFLELTNKNTSGAVVERFNEIWATEATRLAQAQGLAATFDHRSNMRQGIDYKPQPRLGQRVVAMERRGVQTEMGDTWQQHVAAHPTPDTMSHAAALADIAREQKTLKNRTPGYDRSNHHRAPTLDRNRLDVARVRSRADGVDAVLPVRTLDRPPVGISPAAGHAAGGFATFGSGHLLRRDEQGYNRAGQTLLVVRREALTPQPGPLRAPPGAGATGAKQPNAALALRLLKDRQKREIETLRQPYQAAKALEKSALADLATANEALAESEQKRQKVRTAAQQHRASWKRRHGRFVSAFSQVQEFEKNRPVIAWALRKLGVALPGEAARDAAEKQRNEAMAKTEKYDQRGQFAEQEIRQKTNLVATATASVDQARHALATVQTDYLAMKERHRVELLTPEQRQAEAVARAQREAEAERAREAARTRLAARPGPPPNPMAPGGRVPPALSGGPRPPRGFGLSR